jgi:hypothetical protein
MDNLPRYIGAFRNKTDGGGFLAQLITADPAKREAFARQWDKPGVSVYDCPNPLLPEAHTREKATIAEQDEVWVDVDLKDLVTPRDTVLDMLWALPLFLEIRDSGGGGFHVGIKLKEPEPHGSPGFERVNELRSQLTHILSGDPIVNQHAHLLRRPGTHNTNYDPAGECRIIRAGTPVDVTEVEAALDLFNRPLFERKPEASKLNGGSHRGDDKGGDTAKLPFDLEQRAAELYYPGNIHAFELHGTASLISSGVDLVCAVDTIMAAVQAHIEAHPPRRPWNWAKEHVRIRRMSYSWINKHPELAPTLPQDMALEHGRILRSNGTPWLRYDHTRKGWWVFSKTPTAESATTQTASPSGWQSYDTAAATSMEWAVKFILAKRGLTALAGPWGMFKSTVALYIAFSLMTGTLFAGRYRIKRRGAVLYFAVEGYGGISYRMRAIADSLGHVGGLPFEYRSDCPPLKEHTSVATLCRYIDEGLTKIRATYGLDTELAAVFFDTWARAAGTDDKGEDDDKGVTSAIIKTLTAVEAYAQCVCIPLDHFGKDVSRGIRGSSDKESIDGLLGALGERDISGAVSKTRLAVRKVKDGEAGFEIPFTPHVIKVGVDEDGDPLTAILLDWGAPQDGKPKPKAPSAVEQLYAALDAVVEAEGVPLGRKAGNVRAAARDKVEARFLTDYQGRKETVSEATKRRVFRDALDGEQHGIGRRRDNGTWMLWRTRNTTEGD